MCVGTFWQENIGIQEIFSMINGKDKRSKTMMIKIPAKEILK